MKTNTHLAPKTEMSACKWLNLKNDFKKIMQIIPEHGFSAGCIY